MGRPKGSGVVPLDERLLSRFETGDPWECWPWLGCVNQRGYGVLGAGGRGGKVLLVHRLVYALFVEDIPPDMTVDHLCFNRICLNPDHMEMVPMPENSRRGCMRRWHGQTFWPDREG